MSGANFTEQLVNAAANGQNLAQVWEESNGGQGAIYDDPDSVVDASEVTDTFDQVLNPESQEGTEGKTEAKPAAASESEDFIMVDGKRGAQQKLKIDFNNKEHIKKTYAMAYGARKWQAERDQEKTAHAATKKELSELSTLWDGLNKTWQAGTSPDERYLNLINYIEGKEGAGQGFLEQYYQKRLAREQASPEQRASWDKQEADQRLAQESARKDAELNKLREEQAKFMKEVRTKEANALVQPVFNAFSYEGKLGDPDQEYTLNRLLWDQTTERMSKDYPEEHSFSREELQKEFKQTKANLNKLFKLTAKHAEQKADGIIKKKKDQAATQVQNIAKAGYSSKGQSSEMDEMVRRGDFMGLLSNPSKFFKF